MAQERSFPPVQVFTAQAATGTSREVDVDGLNHIAFQYTGAGVSAVSIQLEITLDGTNWDILGAALTDKDGGYQPGTAATPAKKARLNLTALTGGAITANIVAG